MLAKLEKPSQKSVYSQAHTACSTVSYHRDRIYTPCGTCAAIGSFRDLKHTVGHRKGRGQDWCGARLHSLDP